jgi:hypothetical protein
MTVLATTDSPHYTSQPRHSELWEKRLVAGFLWSGHLCLSFARVPNGFNC